MMSKKSVHFFLWLFSYQLSEKRREKSLHTPFITNNDVQPIVKQETDIKS